MDGKDSINRMKQELQATDLQWEPEIDGELMGLFYLDECWDLASVDKTDDREVLMKLQSLEALIPAFEARIGHSDKNFSAWKRLHQFEMNSGRAQLIQMFVEMIKRSEDGTEKIQWAEKKWETRYAWIVRQREELAENRLDYLDRQGLSPDRNAFFGQKVQKPLRITVPHSKKPRSGPRIQRTNQNWYLSIEERLKGAAKTPDITYDMLRDAFWGDVLGQPPKLPEFRITCPEPAIHIKLEDAAPLLSEAVEGDKENILQVKVEESDDQALSHADRFF